MNPIRNKNYFRKKKKISNGINVISLITDFGLTDNFVGVMKQDTFKRFTKNKKIKIYIKDKIIDRLSHNYAEGNPLKPLAIMDSFNYLEIALNSGSAKDYLGINKAEKVVIQR